MSIIPILSKQNTMTRWYLCHYCEDQFRETTAVTMPQEKVKCQGCGKTGSCVASAEIK